MSPAFHLDAPAKVNLGLRILGLRSDGYHLLESLFAPLDLADTLSLRVEPAPVPEVALRVEGEVPTPPGPENLAWRAAQGFLERSGQAARVEIGLVKRTPAAAGLGGGSSDAAAVLRGLQRALPDALADPALAALALELGADVPFFLAGGPAWVSGVGERVEAERALPALTLLLANPGDALATREVYRAWDALGSGPSEPARRPGDWDAVLADDEALAALLHNDLESAALRLCPAIGRVRRALLEAGAIATGLSGSGATCFGIFPDRSSAGIAAARLALPAPGWWRVASTREWG